MTNYLIIYAHPNPFSFTSAIKETVIREINRAGQDVKIRDLYEINFNPVLSDNDLKNTDTGVFDDDIVTEHQYILWADHIIFIYPLWWISMPAILKGYIDRVLCKGFAYNFGDGNYEKLLTSKKVSIITSMGTSYHVYDKCGMTILIKNAMSDIFSFCGMSVEKHILLGSVTTANISEREEMLSYVKRYINKTIVI